MADFFTLGPKFVPGPKLVAGAISEMLVQAASAELPPADSVTSTTCRIARWAGAVGEAIDVEEVALQNVDSDVEAALPDLLAPGGCLLLVYALVCTRGADRVSQDMKAETGVVEGSLITGPNSICSMELVSLFLIGVAKSNVFAYHQITKAKVEWPTGLGIGLLSYTEKEAGQKGPN